MKPQRFDPYSTPWLTVDKDHFETSYARNVIMHAKLSEIVRYKQFNDEKRMAQVEDACVAMHRMVTHYLIDAAPCDYWREKVRGKADEYRARGQEFWKEKMLWRGAFDGTAGREDALESSLMGVGRVAVEDFNVLLRCPRMLTKLDGMKEEEEDRAGDYYEWAASITVCPGGWRLNDHMDTQAIHSPRTDRRLKETPFAPQWRDGLGRFLSCKE
ncbi:hypothetical protein EJ05DRAFT_477206 [Pseudovirgaria hyperparasitica]|uniref:Uncharacterized protein n=1 Tax=Pseudovirgaria hyperparasitica TaxID=470096 RepID=A0A6A6W4L9_9PEZI|nr:uncharacterized protein EJ05DRAFT_477206 [Pseudovirgaria hyperparasitica]KAF2756984.1 hypothetical protein EJ05DRAFT_477206 [Pseudovirgaria hyperparasitica]